MGCAVDCYTSAVNDAHWCLIRRFVFASSNSEEIKSSVIPFCVSTKENIKNMSGSLLIKALLLYRD